MTTAPVVDVVAGFSTPAARLARVFPFRTVVLPWLVARLVAVPVLVMSVPGDRFSAGALLSMDGNWFRFIAVDWYDRPFASGLWTEYPFFPLFPAIAGILMRLGLPDTVALAGLSWLASLVAFAGLYRLAVTHLEGRSARWVIWVLALAPGSLSLVLAYSDALFLAGVAWALVAADRRRWLIAGMIATCATASRPNGALIVAVLIVAVIVTRAGWRAALAVSVPSALFLSGWMWYLDSYVGDPLAFWGAKDAWSELSLWEFFSDSYRDPLALFHVALFFVAVVAYIVRVQYQPVVWGVLTALIVLPPLVLGVVGLARYAVLAFPIQFAIADVLAARGRVWLGGYLVVSALALGIFAHLVVAESWLP